MPRGAISRHPTDRLATLRGGRSMSWTQCLATLEGMQSADYSIRSESAKHEGRPPTPRPSPAGASGLRAGDPAGAARGGRTRPPTRPVCPDRAIGHGIPARNGPLLPQHPGLPTRSKRPRGAVHAAHAESTRQVRRTPHVIDGGKPENPPSYRLREVACRKVQRRQALARRAESVTLLSRFGKSKELPTGRNAPDGYDLKPCTDHQTSRPAT